MGGKVLASLLLLQKVMRGIFRLMLILFPMTLWARVPLVHEVQERAVRFAGFDSHDVREWRKDVRWAAALPRLQVGFDRDLKDVVKLSTKDNVSITGGDVFVGPEENNFDQNFQQGTAVEVRAVWYLDELVFRRDRLEVSRETRDWVQDRARLLERVTEIYFAWKRETEKVHREELQGMLDAHTGGWFSEELGRRR